MVRTLGAQISHMLRDRGVEVIFGIPGVHNQEMYRGIEEAGLTHVLARHEQGAGFMADGYARASRRPGVAYVISGPGVTNIMTPMGQAYSDRVPLLVISSCLDETAARRGQLHQMRDQAGAARTVCAWSEEARDASATYTLIDRALAEMRAGHRRPCHIQVPIAALEGAAPSFPPAAVPGPSVSDIAPTHVEALRDMLRVARKPLFIFGGGAVDQRAADGIPPVWLSNFRRIGVASFTTYAARGLIPADAPRHFGAFLARPAAVDVIAEADLVIAVGTELAEVDLWRDHLGHQAPLVRIDTDPEVLADHHRATHPILADGPAYLSALFEGMEPQETDWDVHEIAAKRRAWRQAADSERPGILPVCEALGAVLPDDTMIYSDMTQFAYAAKEIWDMPRAGHWHHPTGFGTLGYALPAAIGGAVARPRKPTVAIAGDYGFQYTMQELTTAVELGLPLPVLIWDNGKLGEIEDSMTRAQIAPTAVTTRNPDFLMFARACGADAVQPASLEGLQNAVTSAFEKDRPTLIHLGAPLSHPSN